MKTNNTKICLCLAFLLSAGLAGGGLLIISRFRGPGRPQRDVLQPGTDLGKLDARSLPHVSLAIPENASIPGLERYDSTLRKLRLVGVEQFKESMSSQHGNYTIILSLLDVKNESDSRASGFFSTAIQAEIAQSHSALVKANVPDLLSQIEDWRRASRDALNRVEIDEQALLATRTRLLELRDGAASGRRRRSQRLEAQVFELKCHHYDSLLGLVVDERRRELNCLLKAIHTSRREELSTAAGGLDTLEGCDDLERRIRRSSGHLDAVILDILGDCRFFLQKELAWRGGLTESRAQLQRLRQAGVAPAEVQPPIQPTTPEVSNAYRDRVCQSLESLQAEEARLQAVVDRLELQLKAEGELPKTQRSE
jgi:hypothetical protein